MTPWAHLVACPENFEVFADVLFIVGEHRLPAHSQYLACHSKLLQDLILATASFSKDQPLVIQQQLQAFSPEAVQTFLNHVYGSAPLESPAAADMLLKVADYFNAPQMMEKAIQYFELIHPADLIKTTDDVLKWLGVADRFNSSALSRKCTNCSNSIC